jgi:hypothetical protein
MKKTIIFGILLIGLNMMKTSAQTITPTTIATLPGITNFHDVIINCDMLEVPDADLDVSPTVKAIVWDNGERFNTTGSQSESWLYFEDQAGYSQIISLGQDAKQPDVVIANDCEPGDGGTPDYIIGVVYIRELGTSYSTGDVHLTTYAVFNAGTALMTVVPWNTSGVISGTPPVTQYGNWDGNPHIDMWTNTGTLVNGLPSLREFAISWAEGYTYTACGTPPPYTSSASQGKLFYSYGDINNPSSAITNMAASSIVCNGMNDVACFYNPEDGTGQMAVLTYGVAGCSSSGLYALEVSKAATSISGGVQLSTDPPMITRVEAMSQYNPSAGAHSKWLVVASMPQSGSSPAFPWEVYSYDDLSNVNFLSTNYSGGTMDVKSPAVAGGVGPVFNGSNIGNTDFITGYYPRDYSNSIGTRIYSRAVDVYTGTMSTELQVNNNAVVYDWDINRIYAVATSSNSGYNILSAYFDGTDILYKESPNTFSYKPGSTGVYEVNHSVAENVYPNPTSRKIHIKNALNSNYVIADITGKKLLSERDESNAIDVSSLPNGLYFIELSDDKGKKTTLKFIKN